MVFSDTLYTKQVFKLKQNIYIVPESLNSVGGMHMLKHLLQLWLEPRILKKFLGVLIKQTPVQVNWNFIGGK